MLLAPFKSNPLSKLEAVSEPSPSPPNPTVGGVELNGTDNTVCGVASFNPTTIGAAEGRETLVGADGIGEEFSRSSSLQQIPFKNISIDLPSSTTTLSKLSSCLAPGEVEEGEEEEEEDKRREGEGKKKKSNNTTLKGGE